MVPFLARACTRLRRRTASRRRTCGSCDPRTRSSPRPRTARGPEARSARTRIPCRAHTASEGRRLAPCPRSTAWCQTSAAGVQLEHQRERPRDSGVVELGRSWTRPRWRQVHDQLAVELPVPGLCQLHPARTHPNGDEAERGAPCGRTRRRPRIWVDRRPLPVSTVARSGRSADPHAPRSSRRGADPCSVRRRSRTACVVEARYQTLTGAYQHTIRSPRGTCPL